MIGRTPDFIQIYRPLKDGVISDYRVTQAMLRHFITEAQGKFKLFKPELVISVPAGSSSTERRAVIEIGVCCQRADFSSHRSWDSNQFLRGQYDY